MAILIDVAILPNLMPPRRQGLGSHFKFFLCVGTPEKVGVMQPFRPLVGLRDGKGEGTTLE